MRNSNSDHRELHAGGILSKGSEADPPRNRIKEVFEGGALKDYGEEMGQVDVPLGEDGTLACLFTKDLLTYVLAGCY